MDNPEPKRASFEWDRVDALPGLANILRCSRKARWVTAPVTVTRAQGGLEREFNLLVEKWLRETAHVSSVKKASLHPAYQRIIGMGREAIPFLLRELQHKPDHWFWALNAVTGEDAAQAEDTFDGAVRAWLDWGHRNGYL